MVQKKVRIKRYFQIVFPLILIFLIGIVGYGTSSQKTLKQRGSFASFKVDSNGILILTLGGDATFLNPILYTDSSSGSVIRAIFNGLAKIDADLEVIPDLARSWKVSKDGTVWTFYLRKGIHWHDGVEFTAEDVKFTFDKILDPLTNSVRRSNYIIDETPIKFVVQDKYVFQAILPKPFAPFLVNMCMNIIPKHLLEKENINKSEFNRRPIGTGPFKFEEWKSADHITVRANDDYFMGKPLLKKIIFRIIPDENARMAALERGEVDETNISPQDYQRFSNLPTVSLFTYDTLSYSYLGFNLANPLFNSKAVRQALSYAIDKDKLVEVIYRGLATPAHAPQSPISWAYNPHVHKYSYNPARAKEILKKEGWKVGENGILEKDRKPFEFTVILNKGNREREKAAIIIQDYFKQIGVKMNIQMMEWSAMIKILNDPTKKDFETVIIGWSLGIDPDDKSIWNSGEYPAGFNFIKYNNPEVDRLIELGRSTIDRSKRKKIYGQIYELITDDAPYLFLWYPKAITGVNKRVGGLSKPGPAGLFLNIEKVFVKK